MPDIPCRHGEKCIFRPKGRCSFVHPDEPRYEAVRHKQARHGGSSERNAWSADATASNTTPLPGGANRWNSSGASKGGNSSSWGNKQNSSSNEMNPSSAWNFSGKSMEQDSASYASDKSGIARETWQISQATDNNSVSTSTGWGTIGGLWGTSESSEVAGDGGWGQIGKGWGSDSAKVRDSSDGSKSGGWEGAGRGWGGENLASERGTDKNNIQKEDKGKGKASDGIHFRQPSLQGMPPPARSGSSLNWNADDEQTAVNTDVSRLRATSPCRQNVPESPVTSPLSPKYAPPMSAVATRAPEPFTPPSRDFMSEALSAGKVDILNPSQVLKYRGPKGRRALYRSTIKHMTTAIILYMEHQKAQNHYDSWKETQMSSIYGHSTPKTRKFLDTERTTVFQRAQDLKSQFQKEVNALINLPDLETAGRKAPSRVLKKEIIAAYTQELQVWFKDLELHKRLLVEKEKEKEKEKEEGEVVDESQDVITEKEEGEVDEEDPRPKPSVLREKGKWTWKELQDASMALDYRIDAAQENFFFNIFTCIGDDANDRLTGLNMHLESSEQEGQLQTNRLSPASEALEKVERKLMQGSEEVAKLLRREADLEEELAALLRRNKEADEVCERAGKLFQEFEQWELDDLSQINAMTEQIKSLHLRKRSSTSSFVSNSTTTITRESPSPPSTFPPEPVSKTDLIPHVRLIVKERLLNELTPRFDDLRRRCSENQQRFQLELEEEAKKLLRSVQDVKIRMTPGRDPSIQPIISPNQVDPLTPPPPNPFMPN